MVSRKKANQIQLFGFMFFLIAHIVYAEFFLEVDITRVIIGYAVGFSAIAAICLFLIKNMRISQISTIITAIVAVHMIGEEMTTLSYSPVVYMLLGTTMVIIGDLRLSYWYAAMVNGAMIFDLTTHYHVIVQSMRIEYYVMLILFCEVILLAQSTVVKMYQEKVKEIEERNRMLNDAQKSKDEFLANMSHEIRTPMNAIIGMTELIMREEDTSEIVKEYCYNIQSSGENLLAIINDILDFSKIESGNMNITYEPYSIASVIQDVANTAMFRRNFKDIEIIIDCNPTLPKVLLGDVLRNRQILMNLVTNAVKYTDSGSVYISVSCHEREGNNWLHMEVRDTGIGIKKEDRDHLFEAFRRMDTRRNRSIEGTGLGLPLCKRLTEIMKGTIEIESEYGVGTTVCVDIPQEIVEASPFLTVENAGDMKIVMYGDREEYAQREQDYYQTTNSHTWEGLGISHRVILSFTELMKAIENGEITHLFTGAMEYTNQRSYFDHIAKKIKVFVMYDPQNLVKLGADVHGVQMPFYSINLASSLNGESFYSRYVDKKEVKITFKAPYARVLIVDDHDVNLRVEEGVLKLYGVACILARSGKEAIDLLKDQDIDIVFMDHMMPEMDGIEATKIIRRIGGEYGKNLPIIALTANAVNDARDMFIKNGFQDFIAKPISMKRIDEVLRRWLPGTKIELIDESAKKQIPEFEDGIVIEQAVHMNINAEAALENMGQQRELYKELLEYCLELEEQRKQEINESFELQDWTEYAIRVHALKGGMRSLGVEELALIAQKQELAAKENRIEEVLDGHAQLLAEYERGHRSIEAFLKTFPL